MATKHPLVSVVILNWNGLEDTKLCLEYVSKLDYPNYEVIVLDNGSSQDQKEYLSKQTNITYVDNPKNTGFAGGHDDALPHAKGEYILLLNNDAVIASDYITQAIKAFDDKEVAVVGGRSYFWNDDEQLFDTTNRFYSYMNVDPITAETTLLMHDYGVTQVVNTASGSSVLVSKAAIDKVGYLWRDFFAYYEETDLFARMKRAGYKIIYNPKLHIWHKNGASSGAQGGSYFFYYHIFRNRFMYAVRNFDEEYLKHFYAHYYASGRAATRGYLQKSGERRLAKGYFDAMVYAKSHLQTLKKSRLQLQEQLGKASYSKQIIKEQTSLSFVVDARKLSQLDIETFAAQLPSTINPLHEYVLLTSSAIKLPASAPKNLRIIHNKGFFDTHPINLAALSARHDWLAVSSAASIPNADKCLSLIADTYLQKPECIQINTSCVIVSKQLYTRAGGFQASTTNLTHSLNDIAEYAYVQDKLHTTNAPSLSDKRASELRTRATIDRRLFAVQQKSSRWHALLQKYYRLQQLTNLAKWTAHPRIPLRLKAGRSKNLLISGATLNKKRLATELKHIRNEVFMYSSEHEAQQNASRIQQQHKEFSQKQLKSVREIPVFIVCFERLHDLKTVVEKLEKLGLKKIVFIDNDSTYQPLLDYYSNSPYQVIPLGRNVGHTSPWSSGIVRTLIPYGYYVVTDPDVIPTDECVANDPIRRLLDIHQAYPAHQKVGLGLKIDDLPDTYPLKQDVVEWEKQFWLTTLEPGVFEAGVDTTFALYKPGTYSYFLHPSLRTGEPFTARHMPWYSDPSKQSKEDIYYKMRASADVTSWNVDDLPERYKKEMGRE